MKITITDTLEKEENQYSEYKEMFKKMIEDKTQKISTKLNMEKEGVELILVNSKSKISTFLITAESQFPIAYKEGTNQIMTIHPKMTGQLFKNHEEEYSLLIDYALHKFYIFKKYGSQHQTDYFFKHFSEIASQVLSDKYLSKLAEFEIKMYTPGKKIIKKDIEMGLFFYLMKTLSGNDFIYQNLDTVFEEKNIKKSLLTIYKKNFDDLILPIKEEILERQRKELELKKNARHDQKRMQHKVNVDKL